MYLVFEDHVKILNYQLPIHSMAFNSPDELHEVTPEGVKSPSQVGWQFWPASKLAVQLPTLPFAGGADASQDPEKKRQHLLHF